MISDRPRRLVAVAGRAARFTVANADIVCSLLVAFVLGLLSFTDLVNVKQLLTGTLVVLTLLSLSAIRDRELRDRMQTTSAEISARLGGIIIRLNHDETIHIAPNQEADNAHLNSLIEAMPRITEARFLAFSGRDARIFLESVLEHPDCETRVLLKHPDSVGPVQQRWILAELDRIKRYLLPRYGSRLAVRCYRQPYSLRGRKLEPHLIDVGWYTPMPGDPVEVVGHTNPLVTARLDSSEGLALATMFDTLFDDLWNASDSEDAASIRTD